MPSRNVSRPSPRRAVRGDAVLRDYAMRGRECAYGNVRMIARALGSLYDDALKPTELRAGQLALLWAVVATEPVEMSRLADVTLTDQTTLSRTVANLARDGLVTLARGQDARTKLVRVTARGRARFAAAMPYWEEAQRRAAHLLCVADIRALAHRVYKHAGNDLSLAR